MSIRSKTILAGITGALVVGGMALVERGPAAGTMVHVSEYALDPDTLTIGRGDEVIWKAAIPTGPLISSSGSPRRTAPV